MHVDTITYTDYAGNERTETFRFNLNQRELTRLGAELGILDAVVKEDAVDEKAAVQFLQDQPASKSFIFLDKIVLASYGKISQDGRRFEKNNGEYAQELSETPIYNDLLWDLILNPEKLSKFLEETIESIPENDREKATTAIEQFKERNSHANPIPPTVQ